jgi:hypothetical protein
MKIRLTERAKRNLCMLPAVMILGAIWLSEQLRPAPDFRFDPFPQTSAHTNSAVSLTLRSME